MVMDDVFNIIGKGTIVLGQICTDSIHVEQNVIINMQYLYEFNGMIKEIETYRKKLKTAFMNDYVSLTITGLGSDRIKKGMKIYNK